MAKLWEKTKNAASSVTTTLTSAVTGPKHRTKDEHFSETFNKFKERRTRLKRLEKDVTGFLDSIEGFLTATESVALGNLSFCNAPGPLKTLCEQELATVKKMREDKKNHLEPQMQEQFIRPLHAYLTQYNELKSRVAERNKRKDEMDKLKERRDHYQEKNDPKLAEVSPKHDVAKQAYEDLNEELLRDMPLLMEDSDKYFAPLMALFISNKNKYLQALNAHALNENAVIDLNQAQIPMVREVITPKASSAMTRQYQPSPSSYITPAPQQSLAPDYGTGPQSGGRSPRTSTSGLPNAGNPYGLAPPPAQTQPYPPGAQPAPHPGPTPQLPARPPLQSHTPQARALWDFTGQPGELSFRAGEVINVLSQQGDWWQGEIPGRGRGLFPHNYVQMLV